ncbi:hypothetical protein T484DRAFT_1883127 [Baffinella frigidus]|nr:hypothetical protein T484DRAFT_1883127 [Cryptophyta sp. CCMP2293]
MQPQSQVYGSADGAGSQPAMRATKVHTHHASPARRRVRMLAGLLGAVALLALAVTRMNPESKQVRSDSLGRFAVLRGTLLALARVWSRGEGGAAGTAKGGHWSVPMGNVLMGAECCNEDLCSKYALAACRTKRRAQRAGDVQSSQIHTAIDSLRSNSPGGGGCAPWSCGGGGGGGREPDGREGPAAAQLLRRAAGGGAKRGREASRIRRAHADRGPALQPPLDPPWRPARRRGIRAPRRQPPAPGA